VVECFLAKEDVAGSTPVSRSNNLLFLRFPKQHTARNIGVSCTPGLALYGAGM
jgi:hypothetical protein